MRFYLTVGLLLLGFFSSPAQTLQQALDATNLTWTTSGTGGAGGWAAQTTTTHDGVSAARAAVQASISTSQTSTVQTTVTGPGTLTFWWSGSGPDTDGSQLTCVVGTATQATAPGGAVWTSQTVYLGSGSQTVKWVYSLPPFAPNFYPAYLDQVTWTPGSSVPVVTVHPFAQSVVPGLDATFFVSGGGTPPLRYQWQLNGTDIPGATNTSYIASNVQMQNLGDYRVVISNSVGTATSSNASLEFGELAAWGYSLVNDNRGTAPPRATNILQISGGLQHSLLLTTNSTIVDWGYTNAIPSGPPGNVANALNVSALNGSTVVVNADGSVSAWGNPNITNVPTNVTNIVAVAPGSTAFYCLALKSDGKVVVWGTTSSVTNIPSSLSNVVSIAAGSSHCMALKSDGLISAWGDNTYGQRSVPASLYSSYPNTKPVAIAAGGQHSLALRSDGVVFAWGNNSSGQTNVPSLAKSGVIAIAAGQAHSLALRTNGVVVAWGQNAWGQISVPAKLTNVVAIAAGAYHSLALVGNGSSPHALAASSSFSSNVFSLSLPTQCGRIFELDYLTSLAATNWTPLPYVAGNGTNLVLTDTTATNSSRFYRVRRW